MGEAEESKARERREAEKKEFEQMPWPQRRVRWPLLCAAAEGRLADVRELGRGAVVVEAGPLGMTPLHAAAQDAHAAVAELLLDRGAAVDQGDCVGTPR